jgi:LPXTG-site transpeptidase (sortase) family protein
LNGTSSNASTTYFATLPPETPRFLTISKINLHSIIQGVGLTTSGAVGIPTNYTDAGWFRFGTKPGQIGNAIMDGHVVTRSFGPGVFSKLNSLAVGDSVEIDTYKSHLTFRVVKKMEYNLKDAPLMEIFGPTSKRMLNLITCSGVWNQKIKMYDKRLVVFTELVQSVPSKR